MALTKPAKHARHDRIPTAPPPHEPPALDEDPENLDEEDEIQRLCQELNDAGYKAEISWGQVVVSPWMSRQSADIVDTLTDVLTPLKSANGWRFYQNWAVHVPPFLDHRLPDLMIAPRDAEQFDDMRIRGTSALLVAEVCSPGTRSIDWQDKPLDYARAGVPLFLIIDPVSVPRAVALMSDPVPDLAPDDDRQPYREVVMAEEGQILALPEPFGIKLDTGALFG